MDNSPVLEQAIRKVKRNYMILSAVLGVMTAGMWAVVGSAIHFTEGLYWIGSSVCAGMLSLCLLCSIRVYRNVGHFTIENASNMCNMFSILTYVGNSTLVCSIAGFVLGCMSYSNPSSANKGETAMIASGALVAGSLISMSVILPIRIAKNTSILQVQN